MIRLLATLSAFLTMNVVALAAEPSFQYSKPIEVPALEQEELLSTALDSDVYAATRDDFADIRIKPAGKPAASPAVSYLLRRVTTTKPETSRQLWTVTKPSIKPLPDNALEITLELGKDDPQPEGVRIVSPLINFEQRIRVFSSPDGQTWQPVGDEGVIFDYSQFMDVRNDTVPFPAGTNRHFRIVIDNITQELQSQLVDLTRRLQAGVEQHRDERSFIQRRPFRIDRIEFWRDDVRSEITGDAKTSYPVANLESELDEKFRQTIVSFDSRREPLTSVKLNTKSNNFSRHASVEIDTSTPTETTWRVIGAATISRLNFRNIQRENLTITFPETRAGKYRLVIENRSSDPLTIDSVEAEGNQYQLVFFASPGKDSTAGADELLYGNQDASAPDYDVAAITASLADGYQPKSVALGKQTALVVAAPESLTLRDLLNDGRVLGGLAVLLVAALGWGLYRAGQRLDGLSQDKP